MSTKANLLAGIGTTYIAPTGEALPEINNLAPPTVTVTPAGNWVATGFTSGNFELDYNPTFEDKRVNEVTGPVNTILVDEDATFMISIAEHDLTAWNIAMAASALSTVAAAADQTAQDILKMGGGTATQKALLCLGTSPESGSRVIHIPLAVATSQIKLARRKGYHPEIGIVFKVLTDPTLTAGQRMIVVYDITAAASS